MTKKTSSTERKYLVFRDSNEKVGHGWLFEQGEHCLGTVVRNLHTADYSLEVDGRNLHDEKIFAIERKGRVSEFCGNLTQKEKRDDFFQELDRLEEFKHPFVICEFNFSLLKSYPYGSDIPRKLWSRLRVKPEFLLKCFEEICLRYKTKFIFSSNPSASKELASGLFKRVTECL